MKCFYVILTKSYYCVIAIHTMLTFAPGIFINSLQQDSNVDPVVITSSINKKCLLQ